MIIVSESFNVGLIGIWGSQRGEFKPIRGIPTIIENHNSEWKLEIINARNLLGSRLDQVSEQITLAGTHIAENPNCFWMVEI